MQQRLEYLLRYLVSPIIVLLYLALYGVNIGEQKIFDWIRFGAVSTLAMVAGVLFYVVHISSANI
jgi:hypothetical protein